MNVIKCRYEYDNGEVKEWPVRWAITKRMAGATGKCVNTENSVELNQVLS